MLPYGIKETSCYLVATTLKSEIIFIACQHVHVVM